MGLSCFRAISGWDGSGLGWVGWDLCAGLFYEHRFAMLIIQNDPNFFCPGGSLLLVQSGHLGSIHCISVV